MGVSKAKSKSNKKTAAEKSKSKRIFKKPLFALLLIVFALIASWWIYGVIRYHSAPKEIKVLRSDPIYNLETEDLKIIRRSEDYGGKDWKGVYNQPRVYWEYNYGSVEYIKASFESFGWRQQQVSVEEGLDELYYYSKKIDDELYSVVIRFGALDGGVSISAGRSLR